MTQFVHPGTGEIVDTFPLSAIFELRVLGLMACLWWGWPTSDMKGLS